MDILECFTPWKINMEHTNHQFRKENDLNQTPMIMFHVNLPGRNQMWDSHEFPLVCGMKIKRNQTSK